MIWSKIEIDKEEKCVRIWLANFHCFVRLPNFSVRQDQREGRPEPQEEDQYFFKIY